MEFNRHGEYTIEVQGNSLFMDVCGPFNEEIISDYNLELGRAIDCMIGENWLQLIIMRGEAPLLSPQGEEILIQSLHKRRKNGLSKCAVVMDFEEGKSMVRYQFKKCNDTCNITSAFFNDVQSANEWLGKD
jgi:hypothetical protein